jgi:hypothetical protein
VAQRLLRRLEINFSHGATWNTLISKYIMAIPLSGDAPCMTEHSMCGRLLVTSAMMAKVGAAVWHKQSAAPNLRQALSSG